MVNRPDLMSIPFHWTSQATEKNPIWLHIQNYTAAASWIEERRQEEG